MRVYLVSLAVGVLVGLLYALLHVRSPAPPTVALIGLLGMLVGEQLLPIARRMACGEPVTVEWLMRVCAPSVTGQPALTPKASTAPPEVPAALGERNQT